MRQFSLVSPLWAAFYSRGLYRDVAQNWRAAAIVFLGLLLAVDWLSWFSASLYLSHHQTLNQELKVALQQVPAMRLEKGLVKTEKPDVYVIKDSKTQQPLIIINTRDDQPAALGDEKILITKDRIQFRYYGGYMQQSFAEITSQQHFSKLGPEEIQHIITHIEYPRLGFMIFFFLLIPFFYRILQACVYALIALTFSQLTKANLSYKQLFFLSIIALTPAIIIGKILIYLSIMLPFQKTALFLLAIGYLYFAVAANAR